MGGNDNNYLGRVEIEMGITNYAPDTRRVLTSGLILSG